MVRPITRGVCGIRDTCVNAAASHADPHYQLPSCLTGGKQKAFVVVTAWLVTEWTKPKQSESVKTQSKRVRLG